MFAKMIMAFLRNLLVILFVVAIVQTIAKVARNRSTSQRATILDVLWGEVLFYTVGIGLIYTGLLHAYVQDITAGNIGWQPSPFEYELGWMEIPLGVVAMMSRRRGYEFRLASTIMFSTFSLTAAAQHVDQIRRRKNYAPGNAGLLIWVGDVVVPIVLLAAAALSPRNTNK